MWFQGQSFSNWFDSIDPMVDCAWLARTARAVDLVIVVNCMHLSTFISSRYLDLGGLKSD